MRPRLGGAERTRPTRSTVSPRCFNAAAPGGRGEVLQFGQGLPGLAASMRPRLGGAERLRIAGVVGTGLSASMRPRLGGAERPASSRAASARPRSFNAAAPGGRGEARPPRGGPDEPPRFNAAAPGGRGEAPGPRRACRRRTRFNAAAPGGRGEVIEGSHLFARPLASMRPRLGGAERPCPSPWRTPCQGLQCGRAWGARRGGCPHPDACDRPPLQCGRAWGARRGPPETMISTAPSGLQCGRAWGARRGGLTPLDVCERARFNAAAPGGRGEGRALTPIENMRLASMRPRLGGAERVLARPHGDRAGRASMRPRLGGAERRRSARATRTSRALQCGRAWGARRGRAASCTSPLCRSFNAAAPGGRGEAPAAPHRRHRRSCFNAAAPGGRGEVPTPAATPRSSVLLQCGRAWGARRGGARGRSGSCPRGFNAAAPGGRGEGEAGQRPGLRRVASMRPRLGGAERRGWALSIWTPSPLQCGRAWGARRGPSPPRRTDAPPGFNAAAPGGRGEAKAAKELTGTLLASMRPRLGGAERTIRPSWTTTATGFNAAAPGGRGEAAELRGAGAPHAGFNAAAPGGRGEAPGRPRPPRRR